MNFSNLHNMAKHIDLQVKTLETKVANPMGMIYSNNSNQGVKILSMLKDMSDDIEKKKTNIEQKVLEENTNWAAMVEDYNSVAKFISDVNGKLNEYENTWAAQYPNYKPFVSYNHNESVGVETEFQELDLQEEKHIDDQSFHDSSLCNITMS
ncbi:uncharacterized protein LOC126847567 [Adelges cooleyi]|uniref:uncharacterized protein LOC126847567 n=1 Tax=Adelges cooleyi TaxID=133065 RepID=UPI00218003BC|nr:uncharacterized protein LOC126847567 [Adelges cooleyi]